MFEVRATNVTFPLNALSPDMYEVYRLFEAALLALIVLSVAVTVMTGYAILGHFHFHKNLLIVVYNMYLGFFIYVLCQSASCFWIFFCPAETYLLKSRVLFIHELEVLELVQMIAKLTFVLTTLLLIAERTIATIYLKSYEKQKSYRLMVCVILLQWAVAVFSLFEIYFERTPLLNLSVIGGVISVLYVLLFFYIDRVNQRRYRQTTTVGCSYTLSERYQLGENIRSSRFMTRAIISIGFWNLIAMFNFTMMGLTTDICVKMWFKMGYEFSAVLYTFSFDAAVVMSDELWKQKFFEILRCKKLRVSPSSRTSHEESVPNLRTSSGELMVFSLRDESNVYFEKLRQAWGD